MRSDADWYSQPSRMFVIDLYELTDEADRR
jgi:hypothetical protein